MASALGPAPPLSFRIATYHTLRLGTRVASGGWSATQRYAIGLTLLVAVDFFGAELPDAEVLALLTSR